MKRGIAHLVGVFLIAAILTGCTLLASQDLGELTLRQDALQYVGPPGSAWEVEGRVIVDVIRNDDLLTTPTAENAPDARIRITIPFLVE